MDSAKKRKILIVGGGTAGWMAAHIFAKCWHAQNIDIEIVESPDIGIIGVGEGSTPQLKKFFEYIDIAEAEWMPECNATYKNGIAFHGWSSLAGAETYFHPFFGQADQITLPHFFNSTLLRRQGHDVQTSPNEFFLNAFLADKNLGPILNTDAPFGVSYGYHFDSGLLGKYLCKKANDLGINHIYGTVKAAELNDQGNIEKVVLTDGRYLHADFFIDCTGFGSLLLQKTLGVEFISFSNNLFNDSAVVMPSAPQTIIKPQTTSTALAYGWMWNIPLTNRCGNGYVYSSAYCTSSQAESELRATLGLLESDVAARHIKMKVGRVKQHWFKNCLAVGLSQGFIEPLEATALHLVQETIQGFADAYEGGGWTTQYQDTFNKKINHRFEGIRDYIVCHYLMNTRQDTSYWKDNAANKYISDSLAMILNAWFGRRDMAIELERQGVSGYYQQESWQCLLAGYGKFPSHITLEENVQADQVFNYVREYIQQCSSHFVSHNELLQRLARPAM